MVLVSGIFYISGKRKKALEGLEGVEKASVSFLKQKGEVFFDPGKVSEKEIVDRVNQTGFRAKVIEK